MLPGTATIASLVFRLNRHNLRSVLHSAVDVEFQQVSGYANRTGRTVVSRLGKLGVRAVNMPVGFPFETERWPGKMWPVADKPVAEAAGVGRMGWHRCVIHPEFGSAVTLGTVLVAAELDTYGTAARRQPVHRVQAVRLGVPHRRHRRRRTLRLRLLLHAQLPRAAGRVPGLGGAFWPASRRHGRLPGARQRRRDGVDVAEPLGGPADQVRQVHGRVSRGAGGHRRVPERRGGYRAQVADRLRDKAETVYVVPGSDAEASVTKRFPQKTVKRVGNGLRPNSPRNFLGALPLIFQRGQAEGLDATYHFTFTGMEPCRGNGSDQRQDHYGERRSGGDSRPARDRRRRHLDRVPGQGEGTRRRPAVAQVEARRPAAADVCVREVLPVVGLSASPRRLAPRVDF